MSIVYRIDHEIGITYVVWDGMVTDEEFLAHTQRMLTDPEWPPAGKRHFIDATTVHSFDVVSALALKQAAAKWNILSKTAGIRIVLVAKDGFEESRVFQTMVPLFTPTIMVFHTIPTACVWIGIDPGATERVLEVLRAEERGLNEARSS